MSAEATGTETGTFWSDATLDRLRTELQETGRVNLIGELLPVSLAHRLADDLGIPRSDLRLEGGGVVSLKEAK